MAMEVIMPPPPSVDSNFDSASTSPYISAPSSPQRFNSLFYTAPTSPTHFSVLYHGGDTASGSLSAIPFNWVEKPTKESHISTATSSNYGDAEQNLEEIDFAFEFSGQLEKSSLSADELFDGGKIKPLKTPPKFQFDQNIPLDSPKSPRSPKKLIKEAFTPRHKKNDFAEQTRKQTVREKANENKETEKGISRDNGTRSLSLLRVCDLLFDPEFDEEEPTKSSLIWYKKWRIKDLLLFRSASESRVTEQNQEQKYAMFKKTQKDDAKNLSSGSIDKDTIGSGSSKRKEGPPISAHELHYTANRAVSEEMKKRTFLPYKQGLLGCLKFRPSAHGISRGLVSAGSLSGINK